MNNFQPYRETLNKNEKSIYDKILKGFLSKNQSIKIVFSNVNDINKIIEYIKLDNPKVFYVGNCKYLIESLRSIITIQPQYTYIDTSTIEKAIDDATIKICSRIQALDDWCKIINLHDLFCNSIIYSESGQGSHSILGALLNKSAVCEGIAKAVKHICDNISIECCVVTGDAKSSSSTIMEKHAWNKVRLDGHWYNLDVTFDLTMGAGGYIRHDYFCVNDYDIRKTHFQEYSGMFVSAQKNLDYYSVNRLVINTQKEYVDFVNNKISADNLTFEFKLPTTSDITAVENKIINNTLIAIRNTKYVNVSVQSNLDMLVFVVSIGS